MNKIYLNNEAKLLMFDGSCKLIGDINSNDLLMGSDSFPRKILNNSIVNQKMFEITPIKGNSWICGENQKLSLVHSTKNYIKDITPIDWIESSKTLKSKLKQYSAPINFQDKILPIDSYMLGLWIGDGSISNTEITTIDPEILNYLEEYGKQNNYLIHKYPSKLNPNVIQCRLTKPRNKRKENILRATYKTCIFNNEKRIPINFLTSNFTDRLKLLAGIIDTDGYNSKNVFEIITKYEGLANDIKYLAKSLGFYVYLIPCIKTIKSINFSGLYYRLFISGDTSQIPVILPRKKANKRKINKNALRTGISEINFVGQQHCCELTIESSYVLLDNFIVIGG